ncbi:Sensor protein ZraS [Aquisphaera giovannonii]|uniref:histidine kinase n=1 Tax=Aquisphaera giovannonii TaxID=406548 RepID=A0A5B9WBA5_9BACT|nr:ATP-binding protein [Aquisphaera giovannonii]QEH37534.1 Sensor protein ZraS [Aquisphaera giovannonii]
MDTPQRLSNQTRIAVLLGAIVVIVGVLAALAVGTTARMIRDRDGVARSHATLAEIQETLALVDDAEDQQRGYLLTGDEDLLAPYEEGVARFLKKLDSLRALMDGDESQQHRIGRLALAAQAKFAAMRALIDTRRLLGPNQAADRLAPEVRLGVKDEPRTILGEMVAAEREVLQARIERARRSDVRAIALFAALLASFLLCLLTFFWLIRKSLRRQAEYAHQLRKSREQFALAVRGSNDGLWDWDIENDTVFYSSRWKAQLGYRDEEIAPHFSEFESRIHPGDRDRVMLAIGKYLSGRLRTYSEEFRMRTKDGSYRWILARGVALRDSHGNPFRMAGSHTDTTERKEFESKLAEQNRRLEAAMEAERDTNEALKRAQALMVENEKMAGLGAMVAGVAHEINNPLAFITNNVSMLHRDFAEIVQLLKLHEEASPLIEREAPRTARMIAELRRAVALDDTLSTLPDLLERTSEGLKRIRRIVNDLRLFARLDEGDVNEADLNAGIQSTATIIQGRAREKDVRLELQLAPLPRVTCHAARINQVVMNLMANAIDACSQGGEVTVRTADDDGHVRIEVADNGQGIGPEIRPRIFDPFFTTKPIGKGTGLGLSISYGIVRDHGGTIEVDSTPGHGARFTVTLPVSPPSR